MKIGDYSQTTNGDVARAAATVVWEDCDRPQREIFFETTAEFADGLSCSPNAFLLAMIIAARHHGERRVRVEGKLCPQLRNGLLTAMLQLHTWYGRADHDPCAIEPTGGFAPAPPRPPRVASFMSGGVDALTTLRRNRLDFPLDHPGSIRDGILIHGIDIGGYVDRQNKKDHFRWVVEILGEFARQADFTLLPVYTNLRHVDDADEFFALQWHGSVLAAVAHAFSRRLTAALIPSSPPVPGLIPWGSHPLLDPNYSSWDVAIQHDGVWLHRLEKLQLLIEWDLALQRLRCCYNPLRPDEKLNCGKCEKCLRTMTELLVLGKLSQCKSLACDDVSPQLLQRLQLNFACEQYWRELLGPLEQMGRFDLVDVIKGRVAAYDRNRRWAGPKNIVKQFDNRCLGGILQKLNRRRAAS